MFEQYMQYVDIALKIISAVSLLFIIYLLLTRRKVFQEIENEFRTNIRHNQQLSNEANGIHFENMQQNAQKILNDFNQRLEESLNKNNSKINEQNELLQNMLNAIESLEDQLYKSSQKISLYNEKIMKRDSIIERKTNQIERLKEEKHALQIQQLSDKNRKKN